MDQYIARAGGYLTNPDSTSDCQFCSFRNTDEYLDLSFNIKYSHRWRDIGIFVAFIVFNVCGIFHLRVFCADLVVVDRYGLPLHVFVPHEAVGRAAVIQQGEVCSEASTCFRSSGEGDGVNAFTCSDSLRTSLSRYSSRISHVFVPEQVQWRKLIFSLCISP